MNHSIITSSVEKLASINSLAKMFDQDSEVFRMPSEKILAEIIDIVRDIIFPYHYGQTDVTTIPSQLQGEGIDVRIRHYE